MPFWGTDTLYCIDIDISGRMLQSVDFIQREAILKEVFKCNLQGPTRRSHYQNTITECTVHLLSLYDKKNAVFIHNYRNNTIKDGAIHPTSVEFSTFCKRIGSDDVSEVFDFDCRGRVCCWFKRHLLFQGTILYILTTLLEGRLVCVFG